MWISQRTLCLLVFASFADSKLLDFFDPGQLTFRINRTLGVSHYNTAYACTRAGSGAGDIWIATVSNASMVRPAKCVSLSSSQFSEAFLVTTRPCLLKNQIMPPVKLCPKCAYYHCVTVPPFMKLLIYDHLFSYLHSIISLL